MKPTPASTVLGHCKGEECFNNEEFNYRSVLGMALYLGNNTCPDCSVTISQMAHFSADPKISHAKAMKRLGCYLQGTRDKGLIIRPQHPATLDLHCDADFAGLFTLEEADDPTNCRSHTGYVITLGSSPVIWSSKLQTQIALHTMEAEYLALSAAMKPLLHLRLMYLDISSIMDLPMEEQSMISTVFEDNQACIALATTDPPRLTPRSKHIAVQYHWFRSHLSEDTIRIRYTPSERQLGDLLTKVMTKENFEHARKLVMGW